MRACGLAYNSSMALRIGIDVGGTFTHGVLLRPPAEILAAARTPTTHSSPQGVASGVGEVLRLLLARLDELGLQRSTVELVAHSTTQATNALLEGDVSGVHLLAIVPPGELALVRTALGERLLDIGGGHSIRIWPKLLQDWQTATTQHFPAAVDPGDGIRLADGQLSTVPEPNWRRPGWEAQGVPAGFSVSSRLPAVVIQPLAGSFENREQAVAAHYRASGHSTVCASEITQVLGLKARARTAMVNAAMLPRMLATANYTQQAVAAELPEALLQVVRSDGGAMSIDEMRRQPVLSLLSGPAAGASAALDLSGISEVVFIEVGGTSTDITLISGGRVRHRYATVGGQRLMVPALDLRTVAVGGGSMARATKQLFGSRSAHIAGLPYLFQALAEGGKFQQSRSWSEGRIIGEAASRTERGNAYQVCEFEDGKNAALTLTDYWLGSLDPARRAQAQAEFGFSLSEAGWNELAELTSGWKQQAEATADIVVNSILELARSHRVDISNCTLVGGGGGAPVVLDLVAPKLGLPSKLIDHHTVISAIGAALAVTSVSLSRSVSQPAASDIAELTSAVEQRLAQQGAERVSSDFQFDPQRQVLTVTGRGSRPYDAGSTPQTDAQLAAQAQAVLGNAATLAWGSPEAQLWTAGAGRRRYLRALALARSGRSLWLGELSELFPAPAGEIEKTLLAILERRTQYTDGGPALPGLALIAAGRLIMLDQLGSRELALEVLRWEGLPATAAGCFFMRRATG